MQLSKETIINLLATNDKAIGRALLVLNARQNIDERRDQQSKWRNNRGFRPCHARMGTSMAEYYQQHEFLTSKQIAYWRVRDKTGTMRIAIYWRQLLEEAEKKREKNAREERFHC